MTSEVSLEDDDSDGAIEMESTSSENPFQELEFVRISKTVGFGALTKMQHDKVEQFVNRSGISKELARTVLAANYWEDDQAIQAFFDDPEKLWKKLKIDPAIGGAALPAPEEAEVECQCCYCDVAAAESYTEKCGHTFCHDCWKTYLEGKIKDGQVIGITCPGECKRLLEDDTIDSLVNSEYMARLKEYIVNNFVDRNPLVKWCPTPECASAVLLENPEATDVECSTCRKSFCFACNDEAHLPASCSIVEKWRTKCSDDSETVNWICANTKVCPKCRKPVEKNGGCNHITCPCGNHFCFVCQVSSKTSKLIYNHSCNRFQGTTDGDHSKKEGAREALERFLHYFNRFDNHANSKQLEIKTREKIETKNDEQYTEADVQFLADASNQLVRCRGTLKFTYVFGYYLPACMSSQRLLFEFNQERLERETEQLANLLELPKHKLIHKRREVVDQTVKARTSLAAQLDIARKDMDIEAALEKEAEERAKKEAKTRKQRSRAIPVPGAKRKRTHNAAPRKRQRREEPSRVEAPPAAAHPPRPVVPRAAREEARGLPVPPRRRRREPEERPDEEVGEESSADVDEDQDLLRALHLSRVDAGMVVEAVDQQDEQLQEALRRSLGDT